MVNDPMWSPQMRARLCARPRFSRSQILCRLYYVCAHLPYLFDYQGISICHLALPVASGLKTFGMLLVQLALRHNYVCVLRRLQARPHWGALGIGMKVLFPENSELQHHVPFLRQFLFPPCSEEGT